MKLIRISRCDLCANSAERYWLLEHVHWGMVLASVNSPVEHEEVLHFQGELVRHLTLPGDVTIGISEFVRERIAAALQNCLTDEESAENRLNRSTWFQVLSPTTEANWRVERLYHWVGLDPMGTEVSGELHSDSQEAAIAELRHRGIYPTTVQVAPLPRGEDLPPDAIYPY